ncbi:MAG: glycosyl transferase [Planctomycetaceae bacterium]|jgi:hypothetical protein|nr:glycosyl transferase [Planctomycetaceae bacterium]
MIPKTIHYCWFGGKPLPGLATRCIASWKKYCPDYKIIEWNESNFDVSINDYMNEAYIAKKWAFVSDYFRLWVLFHYGGIYMDTDVEVLRPIDVFLTEKAFSGFESINYVPTGIMAAEVGLPVYKELLDLYRDRHFVNKIGMYDYTTNVRIITDFFQKRGLLLNNQKQVVQNITFYPNDYFCPKIWKTKEVILTKNSYTIHHFEGSWLSKLSIMKRVFRKLIGDKTVDYLKRFLINKSFKIL